MLLAEQNMQKDSFQVIKNKLVQRRKKAIAKIHQRILKKSELYIRDFVMNIHNDSHETCDYACVFYSLFLLNLCFA